MRDFYLPYYKYEYVDWLHQRYPTSSIQKWLKMNKKRLQAIYCAIRTKRG